MTRIAPAALAAALAVSLAGPAVAENVSSANGAGGQALLAAPSAAQIWIDPNTGCTYTRAQAPGYAPTWHLIVNGASIGGTNARAGCPAVLRSRG